MTRPWRICGNIPKPGHAVIHVPTTRVQAVTVDRAFLEHNCAKRAYGPGLGARG